MRNLYDVEVNRFRDLSDRVKRFYGSVGDHTCGVFRVPSPKDKRLMMVLASVGEGWDHVSVSRPNRVPNWYEMSYIKRLFFLPDEVAMQLHVGVEDHVNLAQNCLHLWRPLGDVPIPIPPSDLVGPLTDPAVVKGAKHE